MPMASIADAIVFAVYMPPHAPGPGHDERTIDSRVSSSILPVTNSPYAWKAEMMSSFSLAVPDRGEHNVETLFADSVGHETLDGICPSCNACRPRSKTIVLQNSPQCLVLHLKRWKFNARQNAIEKLHTRVSFETLLSLHVQAYDLRSVIVHHGEAGAGHYTASVRAADNYWYHCDDASQPRMCRHVSEVLRCQAYMLMYERR